MVGLILAVVSLAVMPALAYAKQQTARALGSRAPPRSRRDLGVRLTSRSRSSSASPSTSPPAGGGPTPSLRSQCRPSSPCRDERREKRPARSSPKTSSGGCESHRGRFGLLREQLVEECADGRRRVGADEALTGSPSRKTATVGMLWIPKRSASACSASMSILTSSSLPVRFSTSPSIAGPSVRQGPHRPPRSRRRPEARVSVRRRRARRSPL